MPKTGLMVMVLFVNIYLTFPSETQSVSAREGQVEKGVASTRGRYRVSSFKMLRATCNKFIHFDFADLVSNTKKFFDWTREHTSNRAKRQTRNKTNQRKNNSNKNSSKKKQTKSNRKQSDNCLSTRMNWRQYQSYTVINRWIIVIRESWFTM